MKEVWKDVKEYEGYYKISNLGNVMSLSRMIHRSNKSVIVSRNKILKPFLHKQGYIVYFLSKNSKSKQFFAHRLVANSFLDNTNNNPCVLHIDDDVKNNNVENLRWGTHDDNMKDMANKKRGAIGSKNINSKIVLDKSTGIFYESAHEASIAKCISYSTLSGKLNGNIKNNTSLIYA